MSSYTTQLRYACEQFSGFDPVTELPFKTVDEIVAAAREHIFDFQYPIYDPEYKPVLEDLILEHFYTREICAESWGLFKLYLSRKLREIMPYYNKLYLSALLEYNPLHDVDITRTREGHASGVSNSETDRRGTSANNGTMSRTENGTSAGNSHETRETDGTVTNNKTTTGNGTKGVTETTSTETDTTTSSTGNKNSSSEYSDSSTERNAYSKTPEGSVLGVEGDGSGDPENNVSDNYYINDYRKIRNNKNGDASGTEHTTGSETGHSESTGTRSSDEETTDRATEAGTTGTDETVETSRTESGTTSGTAAEETENNGTTTETATGENTFANLDGYIEHVTGKQGAASYSTMILEYRETIINIDAMILADLECCFMQIY